MHLRTAIAGVVLLAIANIGFAQTSNTADERMNRFEQRLSEIEKKYQDQLKAKDEEIARLKAEQKSTPASTQKPKAAGGDEIDKVTQDILKEVQARGSTTQTLRVPASLNPDIAVIGDFAANLSTAQNNPTRNRMDIREVELDLRAAVDPRADGVVILPVARDVEDPLFFNKQNANGDVDTQIEVEEAYIFLHDFGVPNLTAKLGRFHLRFGRWNILHKHDWITTDNTFVNQSFLGAESLNDAGLSLSYVIPPNLVGNQYIELVAEIITGEGDSEAPVLNNNAFVDGPALNLHALWNHDIARDWNLEIGGSWLTGKHNDDSHQNANLFGIDATLIHTDPSGRFNNQLFQFEAIYGIVDTSRTSTQYSYGAFFLAQQQINRDFYTGVRFDWTENALNDKQDVWGISPYLTWYWSEFLRFRVEYQHKQGDTPTEDTLYFQCTFIFGAHPPHPYWAVK